MLPRKNLHSLNSLQVKTKYRSFQQCSGNRPEMDKTVVGGGRKMTRSYFSHSELEPIPTRSQEAGKQAKIFSLDWH